MTLGAIPYGHYWCSPFARWQGSLAQAPALQLCASMAKDALADWGVTADDLDFCAFGQTVMQPGSFYAGPWFTALLGAEHLPAPTITQACATGARLLATALGELALGDAELALIASGDRTSNGPHLVWPAPNQPGGTVAAENWVFDNFGHDPWAKGAMLSTAENVAAREGITTEEQHAVVLHRRAQYDAALADDRTFQRRYMRDVILVDRKGRETLKLAEDEGIEPADPDKIARLRPVVPGGTVTYAGQTHPADGNAGMIVTSADRARTLAPDAPRISVLAVAQAREEAGFMPAAPIRAAARALATVSLSMAAVDVVTSHNPFAVNDIAFSRAHGLAWEDMNPMGSPLIWGHPQGPTGLRAMIELIEILAARGGGIGLFQGCAAGDSAMAVILKVE